HVTDIYPYFSDPTEYEIDDGSGGIIVRRDGTGKYSNVPADAANGKTVVSTVNSFSYLQGVVYFTHNRYNVVPRGDADYGTLTTSVEEPTEVGRPNVFTLSQNYPNPFNPSTRIEYTITQDGPVALRVFNVVGQEVRTLVNDYQSAGHHVAQFNASALPSGIYFYRLQSGSNIEMKKMILIK
ncbi:MAG: T9SS type A sorting domain-containing protein, partial [Bacteroidota bacterium]